MVGLSGAWQTVESQDYVVARLSEIAQGEAKRNKKEEVSHDVPSWKNTTGRLLSERFAQRGISTINFVLSSRHHAFSQANKAEGRQNIHNNSNWPIVVNAWLKIADAELGVPTVLRDLFEKGVAVHTSAMLPVEQAASTMMFSKELVNLMFATGTLAQGLNLPAISVVVSGSSVGDPRDTDREAGLIRSNEIILNGFGRAGRPGFSNQALVVLVSDDYFYAPIVADLSSENILDNYPVLGEPDASVIITSKLDTILDSLQTQGTIQGIGDLELFSTLVARQNVETTAGRLLGSTYGGYMRSKAGTPINEDSVNALVEQTQTTISESENIPNWLSKAAMNAGTSLNHTFHMWEAYQAADIANQSTQGWEVVNWYDAFFSVMQYMPPASIEKYCAPENLKTPSVRTQLRDLSNKIGSPDWHTEWANAWDSLRDIVWLYMSGESFRTIASTFLNVPEDKINNKRTSGAQPIPALFKFIREVIEFGLALDAGCFVAIHEAATADLDHPIPEQLAALPLCIRNGCDSLSTLAWFRFGLRERICAHELARFFPLPPEISDDGGRSKWVRQRRKQWVADVELIETDILEAARTIITSGERF